MEGVQARLLSVKKAAKVSLGLCALSNNKEIVSLQIIKILHSLWPSFLKKDGTGAAEEQKKCRAMSIQKLLWTSQEVLHSQVLQIRFTIPTKKATFDTLFQ